MSNIYYVYLLLDPRKFYQPFYVGKGVGNRAYHHLSKKIVKSENPHKYYTICKIRKEGLEPVVMFWATNLYEDIAYNIEESLIKRFGRKKFDPDGILTNICESNRPPNAKGRKYCKPYTEERRKKIGRANSGYNPNRKSKTPEQYQKRVDNCRLMTAKRIKENLCRKDYKMSDETKQKLSLAKKGKVIGNKNNRWGKKHTTESKIKMSQNRKPKIIQDEACTYQLIDPEGRIFETQNLFYFSKEHRLNSCELRRIAKPENSHRRHRGWGACRL